MADKRGPKIGDAASLWNFTPSPGWTKEESLTLKLCLMKFGVGQWVQIQATGLLPGKLIQQLNGATQRLLGQQSLAAYSGLRVDVDRIRADNAARTEAQRKSGLIIWSGPNPTKEMRARWQQEAKERYGLTPEQLREVEGALEELAAATRTSAAAGAAGGSAPVAALPAGCNIMECDTQQLSAPQKALLVCALHQRLHALCVRAVQQHPQHAPLLTYQQQPAAGWIAAGAAAAAAAATAGGGGGDGSGAEALCGLRARAALAGAAVGGGGAGAAAAGCSRRGKGGKGGKGGGGSKAASRASSVQSGADTAAGAASASAAAGSDAAGASSSGGGGDASASAGATAVAAAAATGGGKKRGAAAGGPKKAAAKKPRGAAAGAAALDAEAAFLAKAAMRASSRGSNRRGGGGNGNGGSHGLLQDMMRVALEAGVAQLAEMGYPRAKALDALRECNCDVELAVEYLTAVCC